MIAHVPIASVLSGKSSELLPSLPPSCPLEKEKIHIYERTFPLKCGHIDLSTLNSPDFPNLKDHHIEFVVYK
tara:strand:+ start:110 stop:325 length:216 start_codon:yes stop_codon:yes gene_type:complete